MSWAYAAASTTQRHSLVGAVSIGATATCTLMAGWARPTATTADVSIFGAGPITGVSTGTAGAESTITVYIDCATTDAVWRPGANTLPLNEWTFIALLMSMTNTSSTESLRLWTGNQDFAPTEQTLTQIVASVGNFVGSTTMTVGNATTGAFGFGGEVGPVFYLAQSSHDITHPLPIATAGTITQAEADLVADRWVEPLYYGRPNMALLAASTGTVEATYFQQGIINNCTRWNRGTVVATPGVAATVGGTPTWSETEPPRRIPPNWMYRRGVTPLGV